MKKKIFAGILILFVAVSAFADRKKEPLIDFIIDVYNQKEPASNENFLKHGFVKNTGGYITVWENLTIQVWVENGSLDRFSFSTNNLQTFLSAWQKFIVYIYDTYNVETSKGFYQDGSILEETTHYTFNNVRVINKAPSHYKFLITHY